MQRVNQDGLVYYQFESLAAFGGLGHGVFTRLGGVSVPPYASLNVGSTVGDDPEQVRVNRERLMGAMGYRDADARTSWQIHSADVLVVRKNDPLVWPPPQADGLITDEPDVPLVMRFADCVPLLFYDPRRRVVGIAHAGWRGTLIGIGPATVRTMCEAFGSHPEDIIAGIGPSIGPTRYEIGPEVVAQVRAAFGDITGLIHPPCNGDNPRLDLWEANRRALVAVGLTQIELAEICTADNTHEFFSHRAEAGQTGRFGALIALHGE